MQRIKELRQASNMTQQALAEMLKTTQQTVARWEKGQAEPSVSALRDIAMIFGTSVDDLLGKNPFSQKIVSSLPIYGARGERDGFWGHAGVLAPGMSKTKWYPITLDEANRIGSNLADDDSEAEWLVFSTLNNRMVMARPAALRRLWLLDDAADAPDDFDLENETYEGQPLEFYRGVQAYFDDREAFDAETSDVFKSIIEDFVKERDLDEENVMDWLHTGRIHLESGECFSYLVDGEHGYNLLFQVENGAVPKMLKLSHSYGEFESYYSPRMVSFVDLPLIDIMDAAKKEMESLDAFEEARAAKADA